MSEVPAQWTDQTLYAAPPTHLSREDCRFYHTLELPEHGVIEGDWDLRNGVRDYLGHVELRGKRVLEVGTASGFLCFAMEQMGAEVVAFDLDEQTDTDMVPMARYPDLAKLRIDHRDLIRRIHNSYWFAHRALGSKARVVYGTAYEIPPGIGPVDVATFGSILLHLRDPFRAVASAAPLVRETIIVTEVLHNRPWEPRVLGQPAFPTTTKPTFHERLRKKAHRLVDRLFFTRSPEPAPEPLPCMVFLPQHTQLETMNSWWFLSPTLIQEFLAVLGFEQSTVTYHHQDYAGGYRLPLFTVVGHRTAKARQAA